MSLKEEEVTGGWLVRRHRGSRGVKGGDETGEQGNKWRTSAILGNVSSAELRAIPSLPHSFCLMTRQDPEGMYWKGRESPPL